jgi:Ca2+-binding RTX toxin-like protein
MGTYEGKTVNVKYLDGLNNTYTALTTDDLIQGYGGADTIYGNARDNYIFGDQRQDPPNYGATDFDATPDGGDFLYGYGGDDTLNPGAGSGNFAAGGTGTDFLDYRYATAGQLVEIEMETGTATAGTYGSATFIEIENIYGSLAGPNIIGGDAGRNEIHGGALADEIRGRDGADTIFGYDGNDVLRGGVGSDLIKGGDGNDKVIGAKGSDRLIGGPGNDKVDGGNGDDKLFGAKGEDKLLGRDGDDRLDGQDGADVLVAGAGSDVLTGGAANDTFVFYASSEDNKITDFEAGDIISIGSGASRFSQLTFTDTAKGLLVEFGAVDILLKGLERTDIGAGDFDFF